MTSGRILILPGIWKVELNHFGKQILYKEFLVMPLKNVFEANDSELEKEWSENFEKFWKFNSMCVKAMLNENLKQSYLFPTSFKSCVDDVSNWSTVYQDPKSDLETTIGLDFNLREKY